MNIGYTQKNKIQRASNFINDRTYSGHILICVTLEIERSEKSMFG